MNIKSVQCAYVVAKDMDRLQSFYESAMGLAVKFRDPSKWTQFSLPGTSFALSSADEAAQGASGGVVVFEAAGLEGVRERVEASGGRCVNSRDMGNHGTVLTFGDPEGNIFQVFCKATSA